MKKITVHTDGVPHVVIDNMYTENQLEFMWREMEFLTSDIKMSTPFYKGTDHENAGVIERLDQGIFLNHAFPNHQYSDILFNARLVFEPEIRDELRKTPVFRGFDALNYDLTFLSYFQDGNFLKTEFDRCSYTTYTWLYREPAKFEGGDLQFMQYVNDERSFVEKANNRVVIFLGPTPHEITEVKTANKPYDTNSMYLLKQYSYMYPDR